MQFEHELRIFDDAVGLIFEWYGNEFNLCQHDTDDAPNAGSDNNEQRYFVEAREPETRPRTDASVVGMGRE